MKGQISIFEFIEDPTPKFDKNDYLTWCEYCIFNKKGCCNYNVPHKRHCVKGNAFMHRDEDPDKIKWRKLWAKARLEKWG